MSRPIEELEQWVFDYLKEESGKDDVSRESNISDYIDSLDLMNILLDAEEIFFPGTHIPDNVIREWIQNMGTVGDFIDNVKKYINA